MKRYLPFVLAVLLGCLALDVMCVRSALADGSGSGSAPVDVDAGSGSAASSPSPVTVIVAPSTALHDPSTDPLGAIADAKAARKSWPLLVLVILIGLTKLLSFAGGKLAPLGRFLAKGKNAMIVAGLGTLLVACYDTLATGGTWYAVGVAVVGSLLALTTSHAPPAAIEKHGTATA